MIQRECAQALKEAQRRNSNASTATHGSTPTTGDIVLANIGTLLLSTRTIFYVVLSALWKPLKNIKRNMWDREQG